MANDRRRVRTRCGDGGRELPAEGPPLFVPVEVLPATPAPVVAPLEVMLGSGRVVRVPSGFDAGTLRLLLSVLEEKPSC
jgi:hypothetical protein